MKISTILDHIDSGYIVLPEFQRGYVWNRDQVRGLFDSLYRRYPVGGLLVWATASQKSIHRGNGPIGIGVIKLLLDGQQRITSLYGVIRGKPPKFFDGNAQTFAGLRFHIEEETFSFYQPVKMQGDPLWIDVSKLMLTGLGDFITEFSKEASLATKIGEYIGRLSRLQTILDINLHIEEVTGEDKTLDIVVDIFNKVNSGGTKLSKGDLALAKICADWPEARETMKKKLNDWSRVGYNFNLDWFLRSINTVLTGEARFQYLHDKSAEEVKDAFTRAVQHIETCLNLIAGRLGLDHDRVLFGRFAIPVMVRYIDQQTSALEQKQRDKLLFWFVQAAMWGRFSGSTESSIDQDLAALEGKEGGLNKLLEQLKLWQRGFRVEAGHFTGWSLGARFYPILYMLTRMGSAQDWGNGLPLKAQLLGAMSKLEVHHIFPKSQLYKSGYNRTEVNALANFCFLTKDTNLNISNTLPKDYFPKVEKAHPGALASQWIPMDEKLWEIEHFLDFLEARKALLAGELNKRMENLLHGETHWMHSEAEPQDITTFALAPEEEDTLVEKLNQWLTEKGLLQGLVDYELANLETGKPLTVLDLAWPQGIQQDLTQPVALVLSQDANNIAVASQLGYRCFTGSADFKRYVELELLGEGEFQ